MFIGILLRKLDSKNNDKSKVYFCRRNLLSPTLQVKFDFASTLQRGRKLNHHRFSGFKDYQLIY